MLTHRMTIALGLAITSVGLIASGCSKSAEEPGPAAASSDASAEPAAAAADVVIDEPLVAGPGTELITVAVEGMHCQGCADTICKRIRKIDGVREARVSFNAKTAWALVDEDAGPDVDAIAVAVTEAGYKPVTTPVPTTLPAAAPANGLIRAARRCIGLPIPVE